MFTFGIKATTAIVIEAIIAVTLTATPISIYAQQQPKVLLQIYLQKHDSATKHSCNRNR